MGKCKHVGEFGEIPILKLLEILRNNFICYCCNRVTINRMINEVKEIRK